MIAATGGLHEDGLADTADSLGGYDPVRRLEIMKDSRIGAFGVLALVLALLLRAGIARSAGRRQPVDRGRRARRGSCYVPNRRAVAAARFAPARANGAPPRAPGAQAPHALHPRQPPRHF